MATTKNVRNTKASTKTTKAPAAKKARAKVAPPSLGEALKAAGSRAYANDHIRTAAKIGAGAIVGVVLTKTVFA